MTANILKRADLEQSRFHLVRACITAQAHGKLAQFALDTYGAHGPQISGIVRDHFPPWVQAELRQMAHHITTLSDHAYALRPKRVRLATIRALSRAVATRYGSGFYGPRP